MRCLRLCLATAGVGVAVAAVALAQDTVPIELSIDARVVPNKAGTAKHPQAVRIESDAYIKIPEGYDPPLVDTVEVWFPKGGLYNGHKYPKCSQNVLARRGVTACPQGSTMGKGEGQGDCRHGLHLPEDRDRQRRPRHGLLLHGPDQPGACPGAGGRQADEARRALVLQAPHPDPACSSGRGRDPDRAA